MNPLIRVELGGVELQKQNYVFDSDAPTLTFTLQAGCASDTKLALALAQNKLVHETFEAGPIKFDVSRIRRIVDSAKPDEVIWQVWGDD